MQDAALARENPLAEQCPTGTGWSVANPKTIGGVMSHKQRVICRMLLRQLIVSLLNRLFCQIKEINLLGIIDNNERAVNQQKRLFEITSKTY